MAAVEEAQTVWVPTNPQIGEYYQTGTFDIVDPSGVFLVDPDDDQIVDTGVTFTKLPNTTWLDSPGN